MRDDMILNLSPSIGLYMCRVKMASAPKKISVESYVVEIGRARRSIHFYSVLLDVTMYSHVFMVEIQ